MEYVSEKEMLKSISVRVGLTSKSRLTDMSIHTNFPKHFGEAVLNFVELKLATGY